VLLRGTDSADRHGGLDGSLLLKAAPERGDLNA
jgi:hypothetical protein